SICSSIRNDLYTMWIKVLSILLVTPLTMTLEGNSAPPTSCSNDSLAPLPQLMVHRKRGTQILCI
ncbi:hypothetical protein TNCT_163701, partial [Trichonephila clavata]